jgi:hypothetical protein
VKELHVHQRREIYDSSLLLQEWKKSIPDIQKVSQNTKTVQHWIQAETKILDSKKGSMDVKHETVRRGAWM